MTLAVRPTSPAFERLEERNGWKIEPQLSESVVGDSNTGAVRLGSADWRPVPFTELGGTFGGLTLPTGLAFGTDGMLFLADPGGDQILIYTPHEQAFRPLWSPSPAGPGGIPGPYSLRQPRGIAFSPDGDLVVADTGNARVVVYAWPSLQTRRVVNLPGGEPWDVAHDGEGRLYVADAAMARVHRFDSRFWKDSGYHGGAGFLQRPIGLAIAASGEVFVLDEGRNADASNGRGSSEQIVALDDRGRVSPAFVASHLVSFRLPAPLQLVDGMLLLPQSERPGCPALELPGVEVDRSGRLKGEGAMLLARPSGGRYPRFGSYISRPLDSEIVNCAWHRIVLDAEIPKGTTISVRTFTAPAEIDPDRLRSLLPARSSQPIVLSESSLPEVLVQSPRGRFLWLWLEFGSTGEDTPQVRSISIFGPRISSISYLPPAFQEDPVSADFVDRLLSYFDTSFAEIEAKIDDFAGNLDPDSASVDFLSWLGSWLDLTFLAQWPEATRRAFIRRAIELYKKRGTVSGLREFIQLHLAIDTSPSSSQPAVVEHFRLRDYAARRPTGSAELPGGRLHIGGAPLDPGPAEIAYHFTIVLPAALVSESGAVEALRQIIDMQKPAHAEYALRLITPGFRVGCQSTIGVDALVGIHEIEPLGALVLGSSSALSSPGDSQPKLGHARIAVRN